MPQLAQLALVYQSQWFWLLLTLGAIYFLVGRGIVPKVGATIDQRDAQIAADLAAAERLRAEAATAEEAWRAKHNEALAAARAVTGAAKDKSAVEASDRLALANKKLAEESDRAAAALDEASRNALAEVEALAADAARDIVAKLTGATVTEAAARKAVAGAMSRA